MARVGLRRESPLQLGILLLLYQVLAGVGLNRIPPVTLAAVVAQAAAFLGYWDPGLGRPLSRTCLNPGAVLHGGEWGRVFTAAVQHGSDLHLYYNMISLIYKGRILEGLYGTTRFAALLPVLAALTGAAHVALAAAASELTGDASHLGRCAVGFSGVLFAMKVLVNHFEERRTTSQFGFDVPRRLAIWTELLVVQLLVPNASFVGHLAGVVAGLAYLHGLAPLRLAWSPVAAAASLPATLVAAAGLVASHLDLVSKPWVRSHFWMSSTKLVCLNPGHVFDRTSLIRLVSAPLEHAGDVHLATCLFSLLMKGYQLEPRYGSLRFLASLPVSAVASGVAFAGLSKTSDLVLEDWLYSGECVQGLSGVLFALKMGCLAETPTIWNPTSLFELFELLILLEPRTRLLHLSGLLTGLALHLWWWRRRPGAPGYFPGAGIRLAPSGDDAGAGEFEDDGWWAPGQPPPPPQQGPGGWTRSWGYANYPHQQCQQGPAARNNRPYADWASQSGSPWDSASPNPNSAASSLASSSLARGSIDSEYDAAEEEEHESAAVEVENGFRRPPEAGDPGPNRRVTRASARRSMAVAPAPPAYRPSVGGATPPPPPPAGAEAFYSYELRRTQSPLSSASPDIDEIRRRRIQMFQQHTR